MNAISELFIKQKIEFKFVLFSIGQTLLAFLGFLIVPYLLKYPAKVKSISEYVLHTIT